jgi:glycosyltransferase involved in cell wall biosynthesis
LSRSGVIFLHPSDELYGADRVLLELISALPAATVAEVWLPTDLIHPRMPLCHRLSARGVVVRHVELPILRRANRSPRGLALLAGRMVRLGIRLRRARPNLVYCTTSAAMLCAPVARLTRVPHVVGHLQEVWSASDRRLLTGPARSCERLIGASRAVLAALPQRLAARTTIVTNAATEPSYYQPLSEHTGRLRFVVASRWSPRKGYGTLLAAWDRLADPGHLTILGGPSLIGKSVDVATMVAGLRRPETVTVVGEVDDIGPHLDAADVALVPSDEPESFGLVAIEAFARGRPVVAAAAGGLLDVVTAGEDGWLYEPRAVAELSALLAGLTRRQVVDAGANARTSYEKYFTHEAHGRAWRAAIAGLLD